MRRIDTIYHIILFISVFLSLSSQFALAQSDTIQTQLSSNSQQTQITKQNIFTLNIEELLNVEVTSVGKKEQTLSDTAAAVFVITAEDIKQSGVTSIPEALRMAPGIEVARINSNKWSISSRGFNSRFANKLLVMIDGRTVYTPLFSGVFWEVQDTVLEDVERIEVIRGPGATLWGSNAVNGVINVITKNAINTQGTMAVLGAGSYEKGFTTLRHGGKISTNSYGRIYFKGNKRGNFERLNGGLANDDWSMLQSGGRIDTQINSQDQLTIQGDFYQGKVQENISAPILTVPYTLYSNDTTDTSGGNILGRWEHTESLSSDYTLQAYYDYTSRDDAFNKITHHTIDLDFKHRFSFQDRHEIVWGAGYRYIDGQYKLSPGSTLNPDNESEQLYNFFIQDEISLINNTLWLTLGSKFEHNDFTNWEIQPSARIFWNVNNQHKLWSAVSHAVRTPSRYQYNSSILIGTLKAKEEPNTSDFPAAYSLVGSKNVRSEEVTTYEIGYRVIPSNRFSVDMTVFYSEYDNLQDFSFGQASLENNIILNPLNLNNEQSGYTSGFEVASRWQSSAKMNWELSYNYLNQNLNSINDDEYQSHSPHQNVSLRNNIDLSDTVEMNFWLKYTGKFDSRLYQEVVTIDAYTTLDFRLAWQLSRQMNLSLVGQNLLESQHLEYLESAVSEAIEIERSVYIKLRLDY
jgi:iron complex outermembrane receptor protein